MTKRERTDRHGIYAHPDGRMLARHRIRQGNHNRSQRIFSPLAKDEGAVRCISQVHLASSHAPLLPCFERHKRPIDAMRMQSRNFEEAPRPRRH